jgi:hypothetical protein
MPTYTLSQDLGHYTEGENLDEILATAEVLLGGCDTPTTFTVFDDEEKAIAVFTNRRITGTFTKQVWGGRKGDDAIFVEDVDFDATDLLLSTYELSEIQEMKDHDTSSDELGIMLVQWSGPHEVTVVESMLEFFGVERLTDLSESGLSHVKSLLNPRPVAEQTVTLTIKVKIAMAEPEDEQEHADMLTAFTENLDYSVISNTVGVVVKSTEITDC